MANATPASGQPASGTPAAAPAPSAGLPEAERARLTQCFQRGTQNAAKNIDYAVEMFATCVAGDPGNAIFLHHLLVTLRKKHGGKAAGALTSLFAAPARAGLRKLAAAGKSREVIVQGLEIIKSNPGDHTCFMLMADACGALGFLDVQRVYLKAALDAAPADPDVNRHCAAFLAAQGDFDQAIQCWRRVGATKGLSDEAERAIAKLSVDKTLEAGKGLVGRQAAAQKPAVGQKSVAGQPRQPGQPAGGQPAAAADAEPTAPDRRQELERTIAEDPTRIDAYLDLADLLEREATVAEAEQVLVKALAASGNELTVREHVEDRQLRWSRSQVVLAEKRLVEADTPENRGTLEKLRAALLKQEIEIYAARSSRYPENMTWKYELAMRLKSSGNYVEAIKHFQETLNDARRKGAIALELGECFQKIKQYQLAMRNYEVAIESLTDRELELRKRAMYRAGVLAAGLNDVDTARKYLSTLAELDFGYRDVVQRLDKLSAPKDKEAGS
jgi:tetratricopeptide (TPR) repeat protein